MFVADNVREDCYTKGLHGQ